MDKQNAKRWGIVTFCVGVTCGILGHYLPPFVAHVAIFVVASLLALLGTTSVENDNG